MSDKRPLHFVRSGHTLVAVNQHEKDVLSSYDSSQWLQVRLGQPRNRRRNGMYWVVLDICVENGVAPSKDVLHDVLKMQCGLGSTMMTRDGTTFITPGSTAFDKLREHDFAEYFTKAMRFIESDLMPGVDLQTLLSEARRKLDT
ncbi:MAG: hypothetical protein MJH10_09395 [Epibacterium sp.]|nr:hypothetical protein [Epibacterium sp.]NQX73750.1 hypothetical protein [Epibacterium sp.]